MKDKKKIIGIIAIIVAIVAIFTTIGMTVYRKSQGEKKETQKGTVELVVRDQNGITAGRIATFNFKQVFSEDNKPIVMEVTLGEDGVIDFYDVPEGEYELEVIDVKEGYSFAEEDKVKQFHVTANQINTINWSCLRDGRGINIATVDTEENPISDVVIDIYDKEGVYMVTGRTGSNGKVYINLEEDGDYYFQIDQKCEKAQEYKLDETLYQFTIDAEHKIFTTKLVNEKR